MKHTLYYLALAFLIFSCNNNKKETKIKSDTTTSNIETSEILLKNYAVVWNWTTKDEKLVVDNLKAISNELTSLWKKDIIENAYYNSDSKIEKFSYFPNISFSIKAASSEAAEKTLNNLTVVKKEIAAYTIYPIGNLWLKRKPETINKNGITKSFVTIWETKSKLSHELAKKQNDTMLSLWNSGKIENIYFDIEGTQIKNNVTDFVFYVNAKTKAEAIELCESLPVFKEKYSTYKIHEVGVFWMGKYANN
jgi:hypothetical protein